MKSRKMFWMIAVTVMALVLAACGNTGGDNAGGGDNASGAIELSKTETVESVDFGGSISVSYPDGWGVNSDVGAILLSNDPEFIKKAGEAGPGVIPQGTVALGVFVLPGDIIGLMVGGDEPTPVTVLEFFRDNFPLGDGNDTPEFSDVTEITVDGKPAARTTGSSADGDAVIYAIESDGNFAVGFGTTATGEVNNFDDVIKAIIASATYTASE